MSIEKELPLTPSVPPRRGSKLLSGILILVFVAVMAMYILLPAPWPDILLSSLMLGGIIPIVGSIIWSWRTWRHSGTVLLNLGRTESMWPLLSIISVLGAVNWYNFLANKQHEAYRLVQGVFWFSMAAMIFSTVEE